MQTNNFSQIFEWIYGHMSLVTYPALIYGVWRASRWVTVTTEIATRAVTQIDAMASDHFPAMRESLKTQDNALASVDASLKTLVYNQMQFSTAQPVRRKRKN